MRFQSGKIIEGQFQTTNTELVRVLSRREFQLVEFGMLPMQYVDSGVELDPVGELTNQKCNR